MEDKHYFTVKGAKAERVIHGLAEKSFFTDWCYLNPPKPDGKELCDLLVVFDDIALIWQIKDLKVDEKGSYKQADVDKNVRQLSGARRQLFDLKVPVKLKNPRRGEEIFDPGKITTIHLISVLMGNGEGVLPFMDSIKEHQVHVFTREFADIVLRELDTISDFCRYLKAKESIKDKEIVIAGGEENLLAKYLHANRSFGWMDEADVVVIDDTVWTAFLAKTEVIAKKKEDAISYGWDSMIDRAHEGSVRYESVARELARPDRFSRRTLSKAFFEVYGELVNSNHDMIRRHMPLGETTYCFLVTNDDEYPSDKRKQMLGLMCFVARGLAPFNKKVIGVATGRGNKSYDFAYIFVETWTEEFEAHKRNIQSDLNIFAAPRITRYTEDEYPQ